MAVIFDNKYHKIVKNTVNYTTHATEIEMKVYANKESRDREKLCQSKAQQFAKNAQQFLVDNMNNLIAETNNIQPIITISDTEQFFAMHPEIKQKADMVEKIQQEGLFLIDNVLKRDIVKPNLMFLSKWEELGLTDDICRKIDVLGTRTITVDEIAPNDLTSLYGLIKKQIVSAVIDC